MTEIKRETRMKKKGTQYPRSRREQQKVQHMLRGIPEAEQRERNKVIMTKHFPKLITDTK